MFTLNNILSVARSAIAAQQTAVQVASNNIANANTEGYTRQRVVLRPGTAVNTALGPAATGVHVASYERMRDPLLDVSFRRDEGKSAASSMRRDLLRQIEGVFGEPSEYGLGAAMDRFWSAWDDLASDPLNDAARGMVRQRAIQLTSTFQNAAAELDAVASGAETRLRDSLTRLNELGKEVARLNVEIVAAEAGGATANELRDARDRLIDEMAGLASVRVTEQANGSASVFVENTLFVDGGDSKALELTETAGTYGVAVKGSGASVSTAREGSALNEALRVLNEDLPAVGQKLDDLARALVERVNAVHAGAYAAGDGFTNPAGDFFRSDDLPGTPNGYVVSAASITLADPIEQSAANIATSTVAGQPTNNEAALQLAALRNDSNAITSDGIPTTLSGAYQSLVTGVAQETRAAEDSATVFSTLVAQTETRRASVSGVSIDEELIRLMQHQQAYVAATRMVTAVDEMLGELLGMVR